MNKVKLDNLIKDGNIVIPLYMLRLHKKYHLNLDEFVFLMYLCNRKFTLFDPDLIATELNFDIMEVMGYISVLADKGLITLDISKNNGVIEEKISLDNFYEKLSLSLISDFEEEIKVEKDESIFELIEGEFNRKLTPLEKEVVVEWQDNNIPNDLIKEALKEASLNGVSNLRYIDKILIDWMKTGIRKKVDIKKEEKEVEMEIFNCNWLDDEDEI